MITDNATRYASVLQASRDCGEQFVDVRDAMIGEDDNAAHGIPYGHSPLLAHHSSTQTRTLATLNARSDSRQ
jgi:hypothetical protein